jgi:hypothetical protein
LAIYTFSNLQQQYQPQKGYDQGLMAQLYFYLPNIIDLMYIQLLREVVLPLVFLHLENKNITCTVVYVIQGDVLNLCITDVHIRLLMKISFKKYLAKHAWEQKIRCLKNVNNHMESSVTGISQPVCISSNN